MRRNIDPNDIEARARRRVGIKMGFYIHAFVFVLVNLGLFAISTLAGNGRWHVWPLWGWGLALAIHGVVTLVSLRGEGFRQRMLEEEIERLRRRQ